MADEDRAAEILRTAKAERRRPSRALSIAAAVIGGLCTIGFVVLLLADRGSSSSNEPRQATEHGGLGFGFGLLFGVVIGVGVGYAMARQSSRNTP